MLRRYPYRPPSRVKNFLNKRAMNDTAQLSSPPGRKPGTAKLRPPDDMRRQVVAALIPLAACGLQWASWETIQPFAWFLFYPAVFFSSWIGGLPGGLISTVLSTVLSWYFFIPPQFSFAVEKPGSFLTIGMFAVIGVAFGISQDRLREAVLREEEAPAGVPTTADPLESAVSPSTAVLYQGNAALRDAQDRLAKISATTRGFVCSFRMSPDGTACFPFGGERIAEHFGIPQARLSENAAPFLALTHPDDWAGLWESIQESANRLSTWHHEWRVRHPDRDRGESWIEGHSIPLREADGCTLWHGVATDITERKRAEEQSAADLAAMTRLQKLGLLSVVEGNLDPILAEIVDTAIAISGADFGNIQLLDPERGDLRIAAQSGFPPWWIDFWDRVSEGQGVCGTALQQGERVIVEDVEQSPIFAGTPALDMQRKAGVRAVQSTPLVSRSGRTVGMFSTHSRKPGGLDDRKLRLLDLLARQAADIIEHSQNETRLQESEEKYRQIFNNVNDAVQIHEMTENGFPGRLIEVNDIACRLLQYSREELLAKTPFHEIVIPEHSIPVEEIGRRLIAGESVIFETGQIRKDRTVVPVEVHSHAAVIGGKRVLVGVVRDISERKQAEARLLEMTERLRLATNSAKAGVWDWNLRTGELIWDARMLELYGLTPESFPGAVEAWEQGVHPEDFSRAREESRAALRGEMDYNTEFRVRHPDGTVLHIKADGVVLRDEDGKAIRMIGLNTDITERKKAEQEQLLLLQEISRQRGRLQAVLDSIPAAVFIADVNGRIIEVNQGVHSVWGGSRQAPLPESVAGYEVYKGWWAGTDQPLHPEDWPISRALRGEKVILGDSVDIRRFDGTRATVLITAAPVLDKDGLMIGAVAICQDITERKRNEEERERLQAQLNQAQKMESVGRLAGGVAHDFNNMLAVILGHAEMALDLVGPDNPLHTDLEEIQKAASRSSELTRQLLVFARKETIAPRVLDLNETVRNVLKMLRRLLGEDMDLAWKPGLNLWPVKMDSAQIDQILANLCVNARDAITGAGRIVIETENAVFDEQFCVRHAGFLPGEYVMLAVGDNGCGMDAATVSHIFEPFFTTKRMGQGTGLGLATVYGAVKQNGGFIDVHSRPGQGTTFQIYLPRHADGAAPETMDRPLRAAARGSETILLVEDEPMILGMTARILAGLGYGVLPVRTPREAIRLAQEHAGTIDLLMTDVVMPEMNGQDLAQNILPLCPKIRQLFMSGYTADVIAHHGVLSEGVHFIQKPFTAKDLGAKVREALETDTA